MYKTLMQKIHNLLFSINIKLGKHSSHTCQQRKAFYYEASGWHRKAHCAFTYEASGWHSKPIVHFTMKLVGGIASPLCILL